MAVKRSRTVGIVLLGILVVFVVAWVDGGEEPLRSISEPVEIPEVGR